MENLQRWIRHTPMSDPAGHIGRVAELPSDIGLLNSLIQGLLIHSDWLTVYGLDPADYATASRNTLAVAHRLDAILATDPQNLGNPRPPGQRAVGTCRDSRSCCARSCAARAFPLGYAAALQTISGPVGKIIGSASIGTGRLSNGSLATRKWTPQSRCDAGSPLIRQTYRAVRL